MYVFIIITAYHTLLVTIILTLLISQNKHVLTHRINDLLAKFRALREWNIGRKSSCDRKNKEERIQERFGSWDAVWGTPRAF